MMSSNLNHAASVSVGSFRYLSSGSTHLLDTYSGKYIGSAACVAYVAVFDDRSSTAFCRIWPGGTFSKRSLMPVSASNCGCSEIRLSK